MSHRNFVKETIPAEFAFLITPSDANNLEKATRSIYITVAGDLRVTTVGGDDVTFPSGSLAVGIPHPLAVKKVWATSTTATGIVGIA